MSDAYAHNLKPTTAGYKQTNHRNLKEFGSLSYIRKNLLHVNLDRRDIARNIISLF